jgi:hypothetical protein
LLLQVKQIDDTVAILQALVERDDKLEEGAEGKAKLAEKLAKWTGMEVGKAVDPSRSYVYLPASSVQRVKVPGATTVQRFNAIPPWTDHIAARG